jgi:tellurite resistance protein
MNKNQFDLLISECEDYIKYYENIIKSLENRKVINKETLEMIETFKSKKEFFEKVLNVLKVVND